MKMGMWELANAVMPLEVVIRDDLERRRGQGDIGFETKELLRRLFRKIIDTECIIESIR